jgi:hypothetical protein
MSNALAQVVVDFEGPPGNDEGRAPLIGPANVEAVITPPTNIADSSPHRHDQVCRRCGRPLYAVLSVSRGTGPVCHRLLVTL